MPEWKPIPEVPKSNHRLAGWSPNWTSWRQIQWKDGKWWCLTEKGAEACVPTHYSELSTPKAEGGKKNPSRTAKHLKAVA